MATYNVFFEFYGKNMKTTVEANNKIAAKLMVKDRINFIKVETKLPDYNPADFLDDIVNGRI